MAFVYSLTHLTGRRRNDVRRSVVLTVEVNRRSQIVVMLALAASILPTVLGVLLFGVWGALIPPAFVAAGILLWDTRQRRGMRLQNWQAIVHRRKSQSGILFVAGRPVPEPTLVMHHPVVLPAHAVASEQELGYAAGRRSGRRGRLSVEKLAGA